jgi:hypothetical protein
MPDTPLVDLTDVPSPAPTDLLYIVTDPAGTPGDGKIEVQNLGGGSTLVHPDDPALWGTDLGYDVEFDGTTSSLPAGWAWMNQGGAVYDESFGSGSVEVNEDLTWSFRGIDRALPTESTWSAVFAFSYNCPFWTGGNFYSGAYLRQASGNKLVVTGMDWTTAVYRQNRVVRWSSETTDTALISPNQVNVEPAEAAYIKITKHSSTSWDLLRSGDCKTWQPGVLAYDPTASLTPDRIGFGVANSLGILMGLSCKWFRVR